MSKVITVENYQAKIDLRAFFDAMSKEEQREFIRSISIQRDVIECVTNYICGEDEEGWWSSDEPQKRQDILQRIERNQIKDLADNGPSFGWQVWSDLRKALQDIACKKHIYWALRHSPDPWTNENAHTFFKNNGIESDYTTKQADEDIKKLFDMVKAAFEKARLPEPPAPASFYQEI